LTIARALTPQQRADVLHPAAGCQQRQDVVRVDRRDPVVGRGVEVAEVDEVRLGRPRADLAEPPMVAGDDVLDPLSAVWCERQLVMVRSSRMRRAASTASSGSTLIRWL
jgi:hypothetical protein